MTFAGIDGCRGGWIGVVVEGTRREARLYETIEEVAAIAPARVMIDIPIGLPSTGRRACDLAARKLLGPARSRVFLDARRPLLGYHAAGDYAGANLWGKRDGNGVSRQLWNILAKIAEVDRFITPARQQTMLEAHPELAFLRMNGGAPLANKKTRAGRSARRDLVRAAGFAEIDGWLAHLPQGAAPDDLLDACALALAAPAPRRIRCERACDARGLRMEIWY